MFILTNYPARYSSQHSNSTAAVLLLFTIGPYGQAQTTSSSALQTEIQLSYALLNLLPEPIIDPTRTEPIVHRLRKMSNWPAERRLTPVVAEIFEPTGH